MITALSHTTPAPRNTNATRGGWALYAAYMKSPAWRFSNARLEELRLSEGLCRICAKGAPDVRIEVHHRCYDRLGAERVSDLTTLCQPCHALNTKELRRRRLALAGPKASAKVAPFRAPFAKSVRPAAAVRR